ncbi:threonine--tRNA ligase [Buchnera aphidicola]|uniref:threonine--tRNA ligase n=1 Tax=Buchnera aphidicola TaxID=9 RepID=UPI003464A70A
MIKCNAEVTINNKEKFYLEAIRYSCSQLLAYSVKKIYPISKIADSTITKNGFYCDVDIESKLTENDISVLEKNMFFLIKNNFNFMKKIVTWKYARNLFLSRRETYKVYILDNIYKNKSMVEILYYEDYVDICSDIQQVSNINFCRIFKLQTISGAYWKGNRKNKMLQRICGTAWSNKSQLKKYIISIEEAKERDHRIIAKKLDLYHMQDEAPGMVFWHHNGWIIFRELENFVRINLKKYHYQEVKTPFMMDRLIWEKSGHLKNYQESIFTTSSENRHYCIKPMNCPGHVQIFNQKLRSYRDLPIRIAEFGSCHRNEPSGSLHGLMRIRGFTQDDAHIFCTNDQIKKEINDCIKMIYDLYNLFCFKKISVKLSTRPEKRIGDDKIWDFAEQNLVAVLKENNLIFDYQVGEGAFYGPKIEFSLHDSLGRIWQCGTIQLDFYLPTSLDAFYINKNNEHQVPVMIHRAILGSIERFIGILVEEYKGFFPFWLSPIQVVVIGINDNHINYVNRLIKQLSDEGIRVISDFRNDRINFKIREHLLNRIPYIFICGDQEEKDNTVSIRTRSSKKINNVKFNNLIKKLKKDIVDRSINLLEE